MAKFLRYILFGGLILFFPLSQDEAFAEKTVVVLFDLSSSTNDRQGEVQNRTIREQYLRDFVTIVNGMEPGDCLLGGIIGSISGSEGWVIPETCLPGRPGLLDNREVHREQMREARRAAAVRARQVLTSSASASQTDIFGAIRSAHAIFGRYPDTAHVLVIFSDMVQNSNELQMIGHVPGNGDAQRLVNQWRQRGAAPELRGVNVYVWGARHPSEQARVRIEQYWKELFSALGARVIEYAPQAIRFAG